MCIGEFTSGNSLPINIDGHKRLWPVISVGHKVTSGNVVHLARGGVECLGKIYIEIRIGSIVGDSEGPGGFVRVIRETVMVVIAGHRAWIFLRDCPRSQIPSLEASILDDVGGRASGNCGGTTRCRTST